MKASVGQLAGHGHVQAFSWLRAKNAGRNKVYNISNSLKCLQIIPGCGQWEMIWKELEIRLDMEVRKLEGLDLDGFFDTLPTSDEDFAQRAENRELPTRAKVDAAVQAFANGKPLPALSNDEQYFLEKRFFYGWMQAHSFVLLNMQSKTKFVPILQSKRDEQAALERLLIDSWLAHGFLLWIHVETIRYCGIVAGRTARE